MRAVGGTLDREPGAFRLHRGPRSILLAEGHLLFAPEIAAVFDDYFEAVGPGDDASVRDFSRPAVHPVPSLGGDFWLSGPIESIAILESYVAEVSPKVGDIVFDLGANCGLSTVLLARLVGAPGRVHAWEPDPINRQMLERNVAAHAGTIATVHTEAVGGRAGIRRFNAESSLGAGFSDLVPRAGLSDIIEIPVLTLEEAAAQAGAVPAFIKMDVEGAELEILDAAREWLRAHAPTLVIDTNHRVGGDYTSDRVEGILTACGYRARTTRVRGTRLTTAVHPDRRAVPSR